MLMGSTKIVTPFDRKILSTSTSPTPSSIIRPYWNPEQPPPCTYTRRPARYVSSCPIDTSALSGPPRPRLRMLRRMRALPAHVASSTPDEGSPAWAIESSSSNSSETSSLLDSLSACSMTVPPPERSRKTAIGDAPPSTARSAGICPPCCRIAYCSRSSRSESFGRRSSRNARRACFVHLPVAPTSRQTPATRLCRPTQDELGYRRAYHPSGRTFSTP